MIGIVCLDNNNGLMFNERRLSQDMVVSKKILELAEDRDFTMDKKSLSLFSSIMNQANVKSLLIGAHESLEDEVRFFEFENPIKYDPEKLYVFRWNRNYPSDVKVDLSDYTFCEIIEEFSGSSHDKITLELYTKEII